MSAESEKATKRRKSTWLYNKVFQGDGIDIGCGEDILNKNNDFLNIKSVKPFDIDDGDAQYINNFLKDKFDFVHSSQCLEHMVDPFIAIKNWWDIVKTNGHLIFTIPDEDLYEQGVFPSRWNHDHKWTFSIYKEFTWSPKHINVLDLIKSLNDYTIVKIELVDTHYNYNLKNVDQTRGDAEAFIEVILRKNEIK
jgi:SAM-dependent methyltransferase